MNDQYKEQTHSYIRLPMTDNDPVLLEANERVQQQPTEKLREEQEKEVLRWEAWAKGKREEIKRERKNLERRQVTKQQQKRTQQAEKRRSDRHRFAAVELKQDEKEKEAGVADEEVTEEEEHVKKQQLKEI